MPYGNCTYCVLWAYRDATGRRQEETNYGPQRWTSGHRFSWEGILPIKTHCPPISSSSFQLLQLPAELSASTENPRLLSFILFRPEHETATPPCRRLICRLESSSQEAKLHTSSSSLSRASSHTSSSPTPNLPPKPASVRGHPSPGFKVG
ncbi:hypothetical protein BO85DRAFT_169925 [Aspergillus piperis CBS 112811]|uniref:Uncharacterized protein n=1 Tax=Aspergillus piperis CBS 112811 TaxID=1448313 RepID=A0A8G1VH30_9EURO|nr:hypothetical protein BO85DRAFT_169925 [Aspergillus piperis CBS 112811]RAH52956.1 hypothetical protein BO85DRAFT_169925 [Aspergillus piperis CBS 112811]